MRRIAHLTVPSKILVFSQSKSVSDPAQTSNFVMLEMLERHPGLGSGTFPHMQALSQGERVLSSTL